MTAEANARENSRVLKLQHTTANSLQCNASHWHVAVDESAVHDSLSSSIRQRRRDFSIDLIAQ